MTAVTCEKCGKENRAGAKFCTSCGAALTPAPSAAPSPSPPPPLPAGGGQKGEGVAPAAEQVLTQAKSFGQLVKNVVTVGGRAAYAELMAPQPVVRGTVVSEPTIDTVQVPFEGASAGFVGGLLLLLLTLSAEPKGATLLTFLIATLLLVLSWMGVRKPFFSKLSWEAVKSVFAKETPKMVPRESLKVQDAKDGREIDVTLIGERKGRDPSQGALVQVWGIFEDTQKTKLRAWKIEELDSSGKPTGNTLSVPRLYPLVSALFAPAVLFFVIALLRWLL